MLLEIEADHDTAYEIDSLADRVLDGMIAHLSEFLHFTYLLPANPYLNVSSTGGQYL